VAIAEWFSPGESFATPLPDTQWRNEMESIRELRVVDRLYAPLAWPLLGGSLALFRRGCHVASE
jgi:hypothetical protein